MIAQSYPVATRTPLARIALFAALCLVVTAGTAFAQSVPTGYQEYYVLGHEQHMWDMMDKVQNGQGGAQFANGMNSVVTATASADNQVVYYDHWEDGFEADIFSPIQISTLIIGDGDPANGDACDFNSDPCGTDVLLQGDFINFASDQGLGAGCTIPSAQPGTFTELCSSVTVNPRCATLGACTAAEVQFDGGDFITTSGGPLAIIHSQYPPHPVHRWFDRDAISAGGRGRPLLFGPGGRRSLSGLRLPELRDGAISLCRPQPGCLR